MGQLLPYGHLPSHLYVQCLISQQALLKGLDGDQLAREFMHAQVHLAEGAFAQELADAVKLKSGGRRGMMLGPVYSQ